MLMTMLTTVMAFFIFVFLSAIRVVHFLDVCNHSQSVTQVSRQSTSEAGKDLDISCLFYHLKIHENFFLKKIFFVFSAADQKSQLLGVQVWNIQNFIGFWSNLNIGKLSKGKVETPWIFVLFLHHQPSRNKTDLKITKVHLSFSCPLTLIICPDYYDIT